MELISQNYDEAFRLTAEYNHEYLFKRIISMPDVDVAAKNNYAFRKAAKNGHLDILKVLIKYPDVDVASSNNYAFKAAATNGHFEVIEFLLKQPGLNPYVGGDESLIEKDMFEYYSFTSNYALYAAIIGDHSKIVKHLLTKVDDNYINLSYDNYLAFRLAIQNASWNTLDVLLEYLDSIAKLHVAYDCARLGNKRIVDAVCSDDKEACQYAMLGAVEGNDIEIFDAYFNNANIGLSFEDNSILLAAIEIDNEYFVEQLLTKVCVINKIIEEGDFVFQCAIKQGNFKIIQLLLKTNKIDPASDNNKAICIAAKQGNIAVINKLLEYPNVDPAINEDEPLCNAAQNGHAQVVHIFLEQPKVKFNARNSEPFKKAVANGWLAVVRKLLNFGEDPTIYNNYAIKIAAQRGFTSIVEELLDKYKNKIDVSVNDDFAFRRACENNHFEIVKLLVNTQKIDITADNNYGFRRACENGHDKIVEYLLTEPLTKYKIKPFDLNGYTLYKAAKNSHTKIIALLLQHPQLDIIACNKVLIEAAERGSNEIVDMLLDVPGVVADYADSGGMYMAAKRGHHHILKRLLHLSNVKPEAIDNLVVKEAAERGHFKVFELLMTTGKVNIAVNDYEPFKLAAKNGHGVFFRKINLKLPQHVIDEALCLAIEHETPQKKEMIRSHHEYQNLDGNILLIEHLLTIRKANPCVKNNLPVFVAAIHNYYPLIRKLVRSGAVDLFERLSNTILGNDCCTSEVLPLKQIATLYLNKMTQDRVEQLSNNITKVIIGGGIEVALIKKLPQHVNFVGLTKHTTIETVANLPEHVRMVAIYPGVNSLVVSALPKHVIGVDLLPNLEAEVIKTLPSKISAVCIYAGLSVDTISNIPKTVNTIFVMGGLTYEIIIALPENIIIVDIATKRTFENKNKLLVQTSVIYDTTTSNDINLLSPCVYEIILDDNANAEAIACLPARINRAEIRGIGNEESVGKLSPKITIVKLSTNATNKLIRNLSDNVHTLILHGSLIGEDARDALSKKTKVEQICINANIDDVTYSALPISVKQLTFWEKSVLPPVNQIPYHIESIVLYQSDNKAWQNIPKHILEIGISRKTSLEVVKNLLPSVLILTLVDEFTKEHLANMPQHIICVGLCSSATGPLIENIPKHIAIVCVNSKLASTKLSKIPLHVTAVIFTPGVTAELIQCIPSHVVTIGLEKNISEEIDDILAAKNYKKDNIYLGDIYESTRKIYNHYARIKSATIIQHAWQRYKAKSKLKISYEYTQLKKVDKPKSGCCIIS